VARAVTGLAGGAALVVVPFQVYEETRSTLAVGLLGLVTFGVLAPLVFVGGALADSTDRRRLALRCEAGQLLVLLLLLANATLDAPLVAVLFVALALSTASDALQGPALEAMVPRAVPRALLPAAQGWRSLQMTATGIAGPALGGLLIALGGPALAYGAAAAALALSTALLARLAPVPAPEGAARPSLRGVAEGLRFARRRRDLLGTYAVDLSAMVFGLPNAVFPALTEELGGGGVLLGLLYAAPAVGATLATASAGWVDHVRRRGAVVVAAAAAYGVAIAGLGLAPTAPLALACLVAAGAADAVSMVLRLTIWSESVPDALRGRLAALEQLSYASGPALGNAEAGAAAAVLGLRPSLVAGGVACVAGVVVAAARFPELWRYAPPRGDATAPAPAT